MGCQGQEVGQGYGKVGQTFSYEINKVWGSNVKHGDDSW